jgi:hypothetical protein
VKTRAIRKGFKRLTERSEKMTLNLVEQKKNIILKGKGSFMEPVISVIAILIAHTRKGLVSAIVYISR